MTKVIVGKDTLTTTPNHPFYLPTEVSEADGSHWLNAGSLRKGAMILLASGIMASVDTAYTYAATEKVYNFEIENLHNYYVGESGILVHNGNCIVNVLNDFLDNHNIIKNWKGRTILQKAGVEVAEIKNGQLLPTKYESAGTAVGDVTDGYQVVKNGNNWGVKRVPDTAPYSPSELTELTQHPQAHVLERHGHDVCDEALIKRANEGIAPDGSTIGNSSSPVRPPYSSKFETSDQLKKALQNTSPTSSAWATKQPNKYGGWDVIHELTDGTFYGKGVPKFTNSFQKMNKVLASYAETSPGKFELVTMYPTK